MHQVRQMNPEVNHAITWHFENVLKAYAILDEKNDAVQTTQAIINRLLKAIDDLVEKIANAQTNLDSKKSFGDLDLSKCDAQQIHHKIDSLQNKILNCERFIERLTLNIEKREKSHKVEV